MNTAGDATVTCNGGGNLLLNSTGVGSGGHVTINSRDSIQNNTRYISNVCDIYNSTCTGNVEMWGKSTLLISTGTGAADGTSIAGRKLDLGIGTNCVAVNVGNATANTAVAVNGGAITLAGNPVTMNSSGAITLAGNSVTVNSAGAITLAGNPVTLSSAGTTQWTTTAGNMNMTNSSASGSVNVSANGSVEMWGKNTLLTSIGTGAADGTSIAGRKVDIGIGTDCVAVNVGNAAANTAVAVNGGAITLAGNPVNMNSAGAITLAGNPVNMNSAGTTQWTTTAGNMNMTNSSESGTVNVSANGVVNISSSAPTNFNNAMALTTPNGSITIQAGEGYQVHAGGLRTLNLAGSFVVTNAYAHRTTATTDITTTSYYRNMNADRIIIQPNTDWTGGYLTVKSPVFEVEGLATVKNSLVVWDAYEMKTRSTGTAPSIRGADSDTCVFSAFDENNEPQVWFKSSTLTYPLSKKVFGETSVYKTSPITADTSTWVQLTNQIALNTWFLVHGFTDFSRKYYCTPAEDGMTVSIAGTYSVRFMMTGAFNLTGRATYEVGYTLTGAAPSSSNAPTYEVIADRETEPNNEDIPLRFHGEWIVPMTANQKIQMYCRVLNGPTSVTMYLLNARLLVERM
jgi:hypothetical protein